MYIDGAMPLKPHGDRSTAPRARASPSTRARERAFVLCMCDGNDLKVIKFNAYRLVVVYKVHDAGRTCIYSVDGLIERLAALALAMA